MSYAMQQWDGLINDIQMNALVGEADKAIASWQAEAKRFEQRALRAEDEVCGGFAVQTALETFVARVWPTHPLLKDKDLRQRIYKAGVTSGNLENSYGAAREAGRTFVMPHEVNALISEMTDARLTREEKLLASQKRVLELESRLDTVSAQLQTVIRDCAHHMAQSAAFREQLTQLDPEHPLVTDGGLRARIAQTAYEHLQSNGGRDWSVVREVGRTFAMPRRRDGQGDIHDVDAEALSMPADPSEDALLADRNRGSEDEVREPADANLMHVRQSADPAPAGEPSEA